MKKHVRAAALGMAALTLSVISAPAIAQAQPTAPCVTARITSITMPSGPAKYQSGVIRLSNGGSLQLSGPMNAPAMYPVKQMRANDAVAACYGHIEHYADAGPSRTITILDRRTSGYYGSLIGTWPAH